MKDNHYRQLCLMPDDYDKVVAWLAAHTYRNYPERQAEDIASLDVNTAIHAIVYDCSEPRPRGQLRATPVSCASTTKPVRVLVGVVP